MKVLFVLFFVVVVLVVFFVGLQFLASELPNAGRVLSLLKELDAARGSTLLVGSLAFCTIAMLPTSILNLGAGAALGVLLGSSAVLSGCLLGACGAFLLSRFLLRDWAARQVQSSSRLQSLVAAVQEQGFLIVLLSRLSPAFPFLS